MRQGSQRHTAALYSGRRSAIGRLALSYIQALHGPTRVARRDFNNEFTVNQPESFHVGFQ